MVYASVVLLTMATAVEPAHSIRRFGSDFYQSVVLVENATLGHTTQLMPQNRGTDLDSEISDVLDQLQAILKSSQSKKSDLVKLNLYTESDDAYSQVIQRLEDWSNPDHRPAVTFVTTRLPQEAGFALDAVFVYQGESSDSKVIHIGNHAGQPPRFSILPRGDVVYVSGQAKPGDLATATKETLVSLLQTLQAMDLTKDDIVQVKCFLQPMTNVSVVKNEVANFFGSQSTPAISYVEWIASTEHPIEIELVAAAPLKQTKETVSYLTPPNMTSSPVFSRVSRIHGNRRIYIGGLVAEREGTGAEQVHDIFQDLIFLLRTAKSNLRHIAKATYYVTDSDASQQLNKIRPHYYDPQRPPAASKLMVRGIGKQQRSLSIDFIGAPERRPQSVLLSKAEELSPTRSIGYKRVGDRELKLHLFDRSHRESKWQRPVFLAIHGGGWTGGNAKQFYPFAAHFADQGMIGISLEYRLANTSHGTTVFDCVEDVCSSVRWIRRNAEKIGAEPDRIVVMGGSAGGHLAVMTALSQRTRLSKDLEESSSLPNAIIAMYPVIDTSESGYGQAKIGERWKELSPVDNLRDGLPPMLIFHGTGDNVTPFKGAERFNQLSNHLGNFCRLIKKPAGRHGYIIFSEAEYKNALSEMEKFMIEMKMIDFE